MTKHHVVRAKYDYRPKEGNFFDAVTGEWIKPKLHRAGYLTIGGYYMHRLAWFWMNGQWPSPTLDHEDRNRCNNEFGNLFPRTMKQQRGNAAPMRIGGGTGYPGVRIVRAPSGKQLFEAVAPRSKYHTEFHAIGTFDTPVEAHAKYRDAGGTRRPKSPTLLAHYAHHLETRRDNHNSKDRSGFGIAGGDQAHYSGA